MTTFQKLISENKNQRLSEIIEEYIKYWQFTPKTPTNERSGERWTIEEENELANQIEQNVPLQDISTKLQRTNLAIIKRLWEIKKRGLGNFNESTSPFLAEARKDYPRAYLKWTHKEELELQESFNEGQSIQSLSEYHGRSEASIKLKLEKLGFHLDF